MYMYTIYVETCKQNVEPDFFLRFLFLAKVIYDLLSNEVCHICLKFGPF